MKRGLFPQWQENIFWNDTLKMTHSHSSFQGLLGHETRSALQFNFQLKKEPFLLTAAVFPVMAPEKFFTVCYSNSMVHYCAYTRSQLTSRADTWLSHLNRCVSVCTEVTCLEVFPLYNLSYCCVSLSVHSSFRYFLPSYWEFFFSLKFL